MCTLLEEQNSREEDDSCDSMTDVEHKHKQHESPICVQVTPPQVDTKSDGEDSCYIMFDGSSGTMHVTDTDEEQDDEVERLVKSARDLRVDATTPTLSISSSSGYEGNSLSQATTMPNSGTPVSTESVACSNPSMPSSTTSSGDEDECYGNHKVNLDTTKHSDGPDSFGSVNKSFSSVSKAELPDWMVVGESVRISPDSKLGVISYVGKTNFASGVWIGVVLDSPTGKNDGTVNGVTYFECKPKFGIFVKPDKLKCDPKGRALRQAAVKVNGKLK